MAGMNSGATRYDSNIGSYGDGRGVTRGFTQRDTSGITEKRICVVTILDAVDLTSINPHDHHNLSESKVRLYPSFPSLEAIKRRFSRLFTSLFQVNNSPPERSLMVWELRNTKTHGEMCSLTMLLMISMVGLPYKTMHSPETNSRGKTQGTSARTPTELALPQNYAKLVEARRIFMGAPINSIPPGPRSGKEEMRILHGHPWNSPRIQQGPPCQRQAFTPHPAKVEEEKCNCGCCQVRKQDAIIFGG
ncbi:predicted protein [Uncinocarpus reesii 1704]|uniref:Uncharacterized protein n=1 Tax=Uncinocarpus reesii (strain UAMH 1704) TaxID=336963 RepID=C4JTF6_UNCRE|nr:uncharacterized protein UREG_05745 [Uncinocarpus reesii 1704]EEP80903.1 predicted protein [Uncinocarpus reesii 1704]